MIDDTRAVSVALTHSLTMGITTVLVAGLLISSGGLLEDQREQAVRDQITVIGERLVSEITYLDRTVHDEDGTATVETSHPSRVAETQYRASLVEGDARCTAAACVLMESQETDVTVLVPIPDGIDVDGGATARGGHIAVSHDGGEVTLTGGQS